MQNIFASKYNLLYRLGCIFQGYKYNNNILSSFYSVSTNLPLELLELTEPKLSANDNSNIDSSNTIRPTYHSATQ